MIFHEGERLTCGTGGKCGYSGPIPINFNSAVLKSISGDSKAGKSMDLRDTGELSTLKELTPIQTEKMRAGLAL